MEDGTCEILTDILLLLIVQRTLPLLTSIFPIHLNEPAAIFNEEKKNQKKTLTHLTTHHMTAVADLETEGRLGNY